MSQRIQDPWSIHLIKFLIQKNFRFVNQIQEIQFHFQKMKKKNKWVNGKKNEWKMNEWMTEEIHEWKNEWMIEWMNEWMN